MTLATDSTRVLVITPTTVEWEAMRRKLHRPKDDTTAVVPLARGTIGAAEVAVAMPWKGQELTAAIVTQFLHDVDPRYVMLVGVAGGMGPTVAGDLVIPTSVHDLDFGKIEQGRFRRRPEYDWTPDLRLIQYATLVAESEDQTWRRAIAKPRPDGKSIDMMKVRVGNTASSNKVIDDPKHPVIADALTGLTEILAVEMEAIGAWSAVRVAQADRAVGLLMIRGISDVPATSAEKEGEGTKSRGEWKPFAADAAATFAATLLKRLFPKTRKRKKNSASVSASEPEPDQAERSSVPNSQIEALLHAMLLRANGHAENVAIDLGSSLPVDTDVPPSVARLSRRSAAVASLRSRVEQRAWTAIVGPHGSGKTQLAILVSEQATSVRWCSVANLDSHESFRRFLESIAEAKLPSRALCNRVIERLGDGALLVLDDLPSSIDEELTMLLRELAVAAGDRVHILSLSGSVPPTPIRHALRAELYAVETVPEFNEEEAVDLFRAHGAPEQIAKHIALLNAAAHGNPTLLCAVAEYLAAREWKFTGAEVVQILGGAHLTDVSAQILQTLLRDVKDAGSRELFNRMRLAKRRVKLDEVRALAGVTFPIDRVAERLLDLDGLWVRRSTEDSYELAPLARALPEGDLPLSTERACHALLGELIIRKRVLLRDDVIDAVWHFIQADQANRAGSVLAIALTSIIEQEAWHEEFIPHLWTAKPFPATMDRELQMLLRLKQLIIQRKQGNVSDELIRDLARLIEHASAEQASALVACAFQLGIDRRGNERFWEMAMRALERLPDVLPHAAPPTLSIANVQLPHDAWIFATYLTFARIQSIEQLDRWTEYVDRLPQSWRSMFRTSDAFNRATATSEFWLPLVKRNAPPSEWKRASALCLRLARWGRLSGDGLLAAYAARSAMIIEGEYLGDPMAAVALGVGAIREAETAHERFLLNAATAAQLRRAKEYDGAERHIRDALSDREVAPPTEQVIALHFAASLLARHDIAEARRLLEEAVSLIQRDAGTIDAQYGWKVQAELGLAVWKTGDAAGAFASWDAVAQQVWNADREEETSRNFITLLLAVLAGERAGQTARSHRQGTFTTEPVVGTFDRDLRRVETAWDAVYAARLALELSLVASGVNERMRADSWARKAVIAARQSGDPTMRGLAAMEAFAAVLAGNDFAEAAVLLADIVAMETTADELASYGGDSFLSQFALLVAIRVAAVALVDPRHGRAVAVELANTLRGLRQHPDAERLATIFSSALTTGDVTAMTKVIDESPAHTSSLVANVMLAASSDAGIIVRAATHLRLARALHARAQTWGSAYETIVIPYVTDYWKHEVEMNAFRFTAPADVKLSIAASNTIPVGGRLQRVLLAVADALGAPLDSGFRTWLRADGL